MSLNKELENNIFHLCKLININDPDFTIDKPDIQLPKQIDTRHIEKKLLLNVLKMPEAVIADATIDQAVLEKRIFNLTYLPSISLTYSYGSSFSSARQRLIMDENGIPSYGSLKSAIAFRIKIVPNATDISLSFALSTGPTAAMALPPQIAVPELIR